MSEAYKKIDFHTHYLTETYKKFLLKHYGPEPEGFKTPDWTLSLQKELMKENNICHALLGISSPYFCCGDMDETISAVHENNLEIAELLKDEPAIDFLAALPLPYIESSLTEIDYALQLGAKGFSVNTHSEGVYLGDEQLEPVMKKLNEYQALIAVHPTKASSVPNGVCDNLPIPAIEFFFDTTRTFINLSLNRTFEKYPDIRWIFPHAGAFVPFASDRIQVFLKRIDSSLDIFKDIRHVYFDLAGYVEPQMIDALKKVTTTNRLLYGSDWPHTSLSSAKNNGIILECSNKLSKVEKENIFYANGAKLLNF